MRPMKTRWLLHLGAWVAVAAAVHLGALWAGPRLIMQRVLGGVRAEAPAAGVLLPPLTDHTQRRIVMPSPDLLYALCELDLADGPWRIRAEGDAAPGRYWSVALYAANSDNFHVVGDRQLGGRPLDLRVLGPGAAPATATPGTVRSPSGRALVLMRVLVADPARDLAAAEALRRTLRCERER